MSITNITPTEQALAAQVVELQAEVARLTPLQFRQAPCYKFCEATAYQIEERQLLAQVASLNEALSGLKKQLCQQSNLVVNLVETCVEAMNANADAGQKAEQENQRLRGEAGVMRGLLTECAGIILAIDSESEDESNRLDDLHEKIVLAIRGAE